MAARIRDLIGRLTLDEKIGLLHQYQAPIPRLGVGAFITGREALHGVAGLGPATVFPQAIGLASTWNPDLVATVGAAVGTEVRGFHQKDPAHCGLNVWAPVVNLLRDPRWGRNEEGYAEDPLLTSTMAVAYCRGLRGDDPWYLRTAPTLKHFLGYNNETRRCETSSNLPPRVLHEYELPAFRAPIETGAAVAVMAAYNLVNGRPAHLSPLIGEQLRRWATGDILVVSDAHAPSNIAGLQRYLPDHATSHAAMLKAGVDSFTDGDANAAPTVEHLTDALRQGLLDTTAVDTALRHILTVRFRLGEFDPPLRNPYNAVTEKVINCPEHQALAREAARQSIVLLKNSGGVLPLAADETRRIAVVGPLADQLHEDWYSGTLPYAVTARRGIAERLGPSASVTFAEGVDRLTLWSAREAGYLTASDHPAGRPLSVATPGDESAYRFDLFDWGHGVCTLRAAANGRFLTVVDDGTLINSSEQPGGWFVRETFTLETAAGGVVIRHLATGAYLTVDVAGRCHTGAAVPGDATVFLVERVVAGIESAAALSRDADVAIVMLGNHPMINGRETEDRPSLELPSAQMDLLRAVQAANPRTVAVLTSSYPYAIGEAAADLPAVLWSAHGGQEFGHALADVLFGDVGPAGRLTQTWYRTDADLPDLLDYDIINNDSTYLYLGGTPLYPFGHGLTYATFEYANLRLSSDRAAPDETVTVAVDVHNTSGRDSDEVVQLYTRQSRSRVKQPLRQLRGFHRLNVPAGEHRTITFTLPAASLAFWDVVGQRHVVEAARHDIMVGRSSGDIRLAATLHVAGERVSSWHTGRPLHASNADTYENVAFVDATKPAGEAVMATAPGAWVAFDQVSFDPRLTRCTARLSRTDPGAATVVLRADNPLDGPVIASLTTRAAGNRYVWRTTTMGVSPATEPVDVYAVFGAAGVCLRELTFSSG